MASGIRLPGVLGSSWLIFLLYLRPRLARPFGPRFHRCFGVSSRSACQPLSLSLSLGAPTPPPFLFLQFPPPPSSILSIPHPRADPGFIPCWCPRRPACEFFLVRPSDFMSPLCLFLHCPMPALFCLHPAAWLMCVSLYLFHFQCYSFHPCAPSYYDRTYPTLEPVLLRLHFFICMFFSLPV